jgi:hypothetical protein
MSAIKNMRNLNMENENMTEHESYEMISYSRMSGSRDEGLFGSSIATNTKIALHISHAAVQRNLSRDWFYPKGEIIEVLMTPNQFSDFITCPNTSGVPGTITHLEGKRMEFPKFEGKRKLFENEFESSLSGIQQNVKQFQDAVNVILSKQNVTKADKEELKRLAMHVEQDIRANLPFVQASFNESMDKTVTEAKAEFEASVQHTIHSLGLDALHQQVEMKLLEDSHEITSQEGE